MQFYSIIVNRDAKMKELLSGCHFNQPMVKNAPVVLTFAPISTALICGANSTTPVSYDNFLLFTAAIDALLVAPCCVAESEGLGICYLGTTISGRKNH